MSSPPPSSQPEETGETTVLIVDDEEIVLHIASRMVRALGFRAITANDGRSAIERIRERGDEVGLVLLDQNMPGMCGSEVCAALHGLRPGLPIVLFSGCGQEELAKHVQQGRYAGYLLKPFDVNTLRDVMAEALARARKR